MIKIPARHCAKCGAPLRLRDIRGAGSFPCPTCRTLLQAPDSYGRWVAFGSTLFLAAGFWVLGFTGIHLLCAILVAWLPIDFIAINFGKYVIPPKIELYCPKDATFNLRNGG